VYGYPDKGDNDDEIIIIIIIIINAGHQASKTTGEFKTYARARARTHTHTHTQTQTHTNQHVSIQMYQCHASKGYIQIKKLL